MFLVVVLFLLKDDLAKVMMSKVWASGAAGGAGTGRHQAGGGGGQGGATSRQSNTGDGRVNTGPGDRRQGTGNRGYNGGMTDGEGVTHRV